MNTLQRIPLFPGAPRPLLFAHRGCSFRAPENTMPAFRLARDEGISGVELDVQLSRDGKVVIFHDESLERICGVEGSVGDFDVAELQRLDAGRWKGPGFTSVRIPLLEELLGEMGSSPGSSPGGKLLFDIEVKYYRPADAAPLLEALAGLVAATATENRIAVSSFDPRILALARRSIPAVPRGLIYDRHSLPRWLPVWTAARYAAVDFLKPRHTLPLPRRKSETPRLCWTVDDGAAAERLIAAGACGIISNRPEDLKPLLKNSSDYGSS